MKNHSVRVAVGLDPATLQRSAAGTISGALYLLVGSQPFPEKGWNDLPVAVLAMWLKTLRPVRSGQDNQAECSFMEGPFTFRVQRTTTTAWRFEALARGAQVHVESVDPEEFWQSLQSAARATVEECRRRGWESRDVAALSQLLNQIMHGRAV